MLLFLIELSVNVGQSLYKECVLENLENAGRNPGCEKVHKKI